MHPDAPSFGREGVARRLKQNIQENVRSMRKTKVLIARLWLDVLQKFDNYPWGMCLVGTTKIISFVKVVLHGDTRYIALSGTLKPDPFIWKQRTGLTRQLPDRLMRDVTVGMHQL